MTGAVAATFGARGATPGGPLNAPSPLVWNDIYGEDSGSTQTLTVGGITTPIQLTASRTGGGLLSYIINGAYMPYAGAFTVSPNDTLAWAISTTGSADRSGVITVTNASAGAMLDRFDYLIYSSHGVRV